MGQPVTAYDLWAVKTALEREFPHITWGDIGRVAYSRLTINGTYSKTCPYFDPNHLVRLWLMARLPKKIQ